MGRYIHITQTAYKLVGELFRKTGDKTLTLGVDDFNFLDLEELCHKVYKK